MKKTVVLIYIITTVAACKKDSTSSSKSPVWLPISYNRYSLQNQRSIKETIRYDQNNTLSSISIQTIDSAGTETSLDSGTYFFTMMAGTNIPASYTYSHRSIIPDRGFDTGLFTENHVLYYNVLNQLIKDSGLNNMATNYYTNSGNTIQQTGYLHDAGNYTMFYRDSLILDNKGTMINSYHFDKNGPGWNVYEVSYTNNQYINPLYMKELSNAVGAFFVLHGLGDFISPDLTTEFGSWNWQTTFGNRVVSGDGGNGESSQYVYQQ